jgi:protein TonB
MSVSLPEKATGALPLFWRAVLFAGVLSMHGLGFALMPQGGANGREKAGAPAVLQVSWIAAPLQAPAGPEPAAAPAPLPAPPEPVIAPEPLPVPPEPVVTPEPVKPKTPVKPKAKTKPLLAKPADAPEPVAQTVSASVTQLQEEAPAAGPAPAQSPANEARAAIAAAVSAANASSANASGAMSAAGAAGRGAPTGPVIPPSHADYLSNPRPDYPAQSRAQGEQGVVFLAVGVNAEGATRSVALHKSCGHERLDQAAMNVVWRWRFVPARQSGQPVAGAVIVPIRFKLRS